MAATRPQPTASQTGRSFFKKYSLEKRHLTIDRRRLEARAIELGSRPRRFPRVETVLAACDLEALGDQLGVVARAAHARPEARVVILAAAQVSNDAHHVLCALGIMLRQPFLEEVPQLVRQPHDDVG